MLSAPSDGQGHALRNDAQRFETSEVSMVLLAGLANALQEFERTGMLSDRLRREFERLPGQRLQDLGSPGQQLGLIAFTLESWDELALKEELARRGINIGANGINCTPQDMQARGLGSVARIALSYFNTQEQIERL